MFAKLRTLIHSAKHLWNIFTKLGFLLTKLKTPWTVTFRVMAVNIEVHHDTDCGPSEFVAKDSGFRCPLPKEALGYTALPDYQYPGEWGSAGFNTAGVGMSSTETIFSSERALASDLCVEDGLAENCTFNIVLPYIRSAREGVLRLGGLIERYGSAESFGIGFIDQKETWYLENACGHGQLPGVARR